MLDLNPLHVVLGVHFGIILVYFVIYLITGKTDFRKEHLIPILFIPVFGLLIGFGILFVKWIGRSNKKPVDMEDLHLGDDIYWQSLKKPHENLDIVPLEEAIHLDSFSVRRRILLDALFEEPTKHIQVLMAARHNEDAETAHYAATTIEKIQRDFQMEIQRYASYLEQNQHDQQILSAYIRLLEKYIQSGLLEGHMADHQRKILAELLDQQLAFNPNDKQTLVRKIRNSLALKEYEIALEVSQVLRLGWPGEEDTWVESLRTSVEAKDQMLFKKIIKRIQEIDIDWSKSARDQLDYWISGFSF